MKLKQQPEDFQVEELTALVPGPAGAFALYRLEKRGWTTPDAVQAVRRRWRLDARRVSYGGLKDRHARTVQHFTVYRGPRRGLHHHDVRVDYLGQVTEPFASRHIRANRFRITLRHLRPAAVPAVVTALDEVARDGLPNYFDDQRFGSVRGHGEFVARYLVRGQFEEALRTALTAPYEFDPGEERRAKQALRECWGDWAACKERLPRGRARSLVDYLLHHAGDFRGAVARLRPELRGLYLSADQSHLWNRMLAAWLERHCPPDRLVSIRLGLGPVPFPRGLNDAARAALAGLTLPLPSARLRLDPADPAAPLIERVLAEEGLELRQLQV